eukprot:scaffold273429_cov27-Tisochrysis_lutea.AAC.1
MLGAQILGLRSPTLKLASTVNRALLAGQRPGSASPTSPSVRMPLRVHLAMAAASQRQPCGVSRTGTLPSGDFFKKAGVLLSLPISKLGTCTGRVSEGKRRKMTTLAAGAAR